MAAIISCTVRSHCQSLPTCSFGLYFALEQRYPSDFGCDHGFGGNNCRVGGGDCVCQNVGSIEILWTGNVPPCSSNVTFTWAGDVSQIWELEHSNILFFSEWEYPLCHYKLKILNLFLNFIRCCNQAVVLSLRRYFRHMRWLGCYRIWGSLNSE